MTRWLWMLPLSGCLQSTWALRVDSVGVGQVWRTDDGCEVSLDAATMHLRRAVVLDQVGGAVGGIEEVTLTLDSGTVSTDPAEVAVRRLSGVRLQVGAPADPFAPLSLGDGGLQVVGAVTCGADTVSFDWVLSGPADQLCGRDDLAVPPSTTLVVPWRVELPSLFAADLDDPLDLFGVAADVVAADGDGDGAVSESELDNAPLDRTLRTGPSDAPLRFGPWLDARSTRLATLPGGWCRLAAPD